MRTRLPKQLETQQKEIFVWQNTAIKTTKKQQVKKFLFSKLNSSFIRQKITLLLNTGHWGQTEEKNYSRRL